MAAGRIRTHVYNNQIHTLESSSFKCSACVA